MKRVTIQVSEATAASQHELAKRWTAAHGSSDGLTSHGSLTVSSLLSMLVEGAGIGITSPGSWEGANMAQVFTSHGYEVWRNGR